MPKTGLAAVSVLLTGRNMGSVFLCLHWALAEPVGHADSACAGGQVD
jgi:hypothetical protein